MRLLLVIFNHCGLHEMSLRGRALLPCLLYNCVVNLSLRVSSRPCPWKRRERERETNNRSARNILTGNCWFDVLETIWTLVEPFIQEKKA